MKTSDLFLRVDVPPLFGQELEKAAEWWLRRFGLIEFKPYDFCRKLVEHIPYDFHCKLEKISGQRYAEFEILGHDACRQPPYETSRAFDLSSGCLFQGFLEIRKDLRDYGYGKIFARNCHNVALMLGLTRLHVTAVEGGAYFWARAGFLPSEENWNHGKCKHLILCKLDSLKTIERPVRTRIERLVDSEKPISLWAIADERTLVASDIQPAHNISLGRALLAESLTTWKGTLEYDDHEYHDQQHKRFNRYILGSAP
ncbi:hypothetical protein ASG19_14105 [Rhizobium sp. Leaf306]|uniref:hypothetical protein n=1 Tax=Rhizobium sp. Leaf306 TaxID=1736330 RepID=UPI0007159D32|nr:hypothetical protein [Rhizobium sp. Leaf306]KQQ34892.1 hypothetical protein ASG19_14105 [Rhizobium sp. Leaf306]